MLIALGLSLTLSAFAAPTGLTVSLRGEHVRTVELGCRGGHRERRPPRSPQPGADPSVWFSTVPNDECTLYFKGVTPARFGPVPRTGILSCVLSGRVARCVKPAPEEGDGLPPQNPLPAAEPEPTAVATPQLTPPGSADSGSGPGLEITLADAPGVSGFELHCRSGHRARAPRPMDGTPARFASVPGRDCRVHFRGTPPAVVHTVLPGTRLSCELKGVTALCAVTPLGH